jgi:hypothetical protein
MREKGLTLTEVERQPELLLTQTESLKHPLTFISQQLADNPNLTKERIFGIIKLSAIDGYLTGRLTKNQAIEQVHNLTYHFNITLPNEWQAIEAQFSDDETYPEYWNEKQGSTEK